MRALTSSSVAWVTAVTAVSAVVTEAWRCPSATSMSCCNFWRAPSISDWVAVLLSADVKPVNVAISSLIVSSWSVYLATLSAVFHLLITLFPADFASLTLSVIASMSSVTCFWAAAISATVDFASFATVCKWSLSVCNVEFLAWSVMLAGTSAVATVVASCTAALRASCNGAKIPSTISCCVLISEAFVVPSFLGSVKSCNFATAVANLSWSSFDNLPIWSSKLAGSSTVACFLAICKSLSACATAPCKSVMASAIALSSNWLLFNKSTIFCFAVATAGTSLISESTIVLTAVLTFSAAVLIAAAVPPLIAVVNSPSESDTNLSFAWSLVTLPATSLPFLTASSRTFSTACLAVSRAVFTRV